MSADSAVLIVDDDANIRDFLRTVLQMNDYAVIEAEDGVSALRQFDDHAPPLVILDIAMPGELDGFQVLQRIRLGGDTPVVMLTTCCGEDDKVRAFELGADDYLTKPFSGRELVSRLKAVLRRTQSAPLDEMQRLIEAGHLRIDRVTREVLVNDRRVKLSRTEFSLLAELALSPGQTLTDRQLLRRVWGAGYDDDLEILRATIRRLRQRIEPDIKAPRYIVRDHSVGYRLQVPDNGGRHEE
ncbi:MAG TPA: response regulator transcription factor [Anaerolineae bacterium]